MSTELKNIKEDIMSKIKDDKLKMRPKMYFVVGSVLTFLGLVSSILFSIFLFGILRFTIRSHGPMAEFRLEQIIANFPLWIPILAILGLSVGIWLIRRYDFSYKFNFKIIIILFIVGIILSGWIFDMAGLSEIWLNRGPMRGTMKKYLQEKNIRYENQINFNFHNRKI